MFINDVMKNGPANGDRSKWKRTAIGDNVSIGSNATILPVEYVTMLSLALALWLQEI
jgi:acetyltransferase-like isoleucine patch superfamily enzyme